MKKSVIAFGILVSVLVSTANANTTPGTENEKGYNVSEKAIKNVAPISIAIAYGDVVTVNKLIELGSNINEKSGTTGMTPLMYAARYNNVELVKTLIAKGADAKVRSAAGFTALKYAEISNAYQVVHFLKSL